MVIVGHGPCHCGSSPTIDDSCSSVLHDGMYLASKCRHPASSRRHPASSRRHSVSSRRHSRRMGGKRGDGTRSNGTSVNGKRSNGKRVNGMCTGGSAIPRRCTGRMHVGRKRLCRRYLPRVHILWQLRTNRKEQPITSQSIRQLPRQIGRRYYRNWITTA